MDHLHMIKMEYIYNNNNKMCVPHKGSNDYVVLESASAASTAN